MKKKLFPFILSIIGIALGIILLVTGNNMKQKDIYNYSSGYTATKISHNTTKFGGDYQTYVYGELYNITSNTGVTASEARETNLYLRYYLPRIGGYGLMTAGALIILHYLKVLYGDVSSVMDEKKRKQSDAVNAGSVEPEPMPELENTNMDSSQYVNL